MIVWNCTSADAAAQLGYLPDWISELDPRGAAEQLDSHYHWGGFSRCPISGFTACPEKCLAYPGDPLLRPIATCQLRHETICLYIAGVVAVWQPDGSFVAARFD